MYASQGTDRDLPRRYPVHWTLSSSRFNSSHSFTMPAYYKLLLTSPTQPSSPSFRSPYQSPGPKPASSPATQRRKPRPRFRKSWPLLPISILGAILLLSILSISWSSRHRAQLELEWDDLPGPRKSTGGERRRGSTPKLEKETRGRGSAISGRSCPFRPSGRSEVRRLVVRLLARVLPQMAERRREVAN